MKFYHWNYGIDKINEVEIIKETKCFVVMQSADGNEFRDKKQTENEIYSKDYNTVYDFGKAHRAKSVKVAQLVLKNRTEEALRFEKVNKRKGV